MSNSELTGQKWASLEHILRAHIVLVGAHTVKVHFFHSCSSHLVIAEITAYSPCRSHSLQDNFCLEKFYLSKTELVVGSMTNPMSVIIPTND